MTFACFSHHEDLGIKRGVPFGSGRCGHCPAPPCWGQGKTSRKKSTRPRVQSRHSHVQSFISRHSGNSITIYKKSSIKSFCVYKPQHQKTNIDLFQALTRVKVSQFRGIYPRAVGKNQLRPGQQICVFRPTQTFNHRVASVFIDHGMRLN
jgi:hypothetical protein